ncbi:hypothetical protein [Streptomyces sp. NPDC096311]|uniref:hypothetical protein n=1 Tax=Streptomyces sp. NPDC096311 TaxID=3366083 RepID=UPI0037FAEB99
MRPKVRHDGEVLREIRTVGKSQEQTVDAATKWIRKYCVGFDYEILRTENLTDRYSEDRRSHFALLRCFIARPEGQAADTFILPQQPPPTDGVDPDEGLRPAV